MKRLMKGFGRGEKGVTLIELLIVLAILGIIAAVIVLNVGGFTRTGTLNAANTEALNVKTASVAYYTEQTPPAWPATSAVTGFDAYYSGKLKALYTFNTTTGMITGATCAAAGQWGATTIQWDTASQMWVKYVPT